MTVLRTAFDFIIDILVFPFENTGDALFLVILFVVAYRICKSVLNFLKRVLPPPYKFYGYASEEEWRASMPQNGPIQKQTTLQKKNTEKEEKDSRIATNGTVRGARQCRVGSETDGQDTSDASTRRQIRLRFLLTGKWVFLTGPKL